MMDLSRRAEPLHREVRVWQTSTELRDATETGEVRFHGEASVVEHPYTVRDAFGDFSETIAEGAFTKTLSENPDVVFLANHGGLPMARTSSKTLTLSAAPHLTADATLDTRDPDVQSILYKIERGDLTEMSFAFRVMRQEWDADYQNRRILEVNLHRGDVSTVTFGANPATSGFLRSEDTEIVELADAYRALEAGTATPEQIDLATRTVAKITDMLPVDESEERAQIERELAELYAKHQLV